MLYERKAREVFFASPMVIVRKLLLQVVKFYPLFNDGECKTANGYGGKPLMFLNNGYLTSTHCLTVDVLHCQGLFLEQTLYSEHNS